MNHKIIQVKQISELNGWILLDKEIGISSAKALTLFKNKLKSIIKSNDIPKIGHGGTLDPLASGILPIAIGEATKTVDYVMLKPKKYLFTIQFGIKTKSYDFDSEVIAVNSFFPSKQQLQNAILNFQGSIKQKPPLHSAIKVNGKRAYKLARAGKDYTLTEREVMIYTLKLLSYKKTLKSATFIASVSKGTYIRSLAKDIASSVNALGTVSYLRRISLGGFKEKPLLLSSFQYNNLSSLTGYLHTIEQVLDDIPVIKFSSNKAREILNGKTKFLENEFFKYFNNGIYKALYKNKVFSLLKIVDGKVIILRNFNNLTLEVGDVDNKRS